MQNKKNTDEIIAKYISGNASDQDRLLIEEWIALSEKNRKTLVATQKAWDSSKSWISSDQIIQDKSQINQSIKQEQQEESKTIKLQLLIYKIAAFIAVPVMLAFSIYFMKEQLGKPQQNLACEITAPKGHISKCLLPDGTEVWINAGSSISYHPDDFNRKERQIKLDGEAYFKVAKNKAKQFVVATPHLDVKVTGTSFNVKAYKDSETCETVLVEGSVELDLKSDSHQIVKMIPGEQVIYNIYKKKLLVKNVDTKVLTAWRNGEIIFKDARLSDLINALERIYEIEFILEDEQIGTYSFRGMFSYENDLISALEKIVKTSQIDYYIKDKKVWLSRKSNN